MGFAFWLLVSSQTRHPLCADPGSTASDYFDRFMQMALSTDVRFSCG